jgi:hypothetical protein
MSIQNAIKTLKKIQSDAEFRKSLFQWRSADETLAFLAENQLSFSPEEFEDAYRNLLVNCQLEDQADQLKDARQCMIMLLGG